MSIFNKIEEVRDQPEHIRLYWVWGFTVVAMVAVVIIWMISFSAQKSEDNVESLGNKELVQELSAQKKAIKDTTNQMKDVVISQ